jgi:hypothetical protein
MVELLPLVLGSWEGCNSDTLGAGTGKTAVFTGKTAVFTGKTTVFTGKTDAVTGKTGTAGVPRLGLFLGDFTLVSTGHP